MANDGCDSLYMESWIIVFLQAWEHGVENIRCILGGDSSLEQIFIDGRSGKV